MLLERLMDIFNPFVDLNVIDKWSFKSWSFLFFPFGFLRLSYKTNVVSESLSDQ